MTDLNERLRVGDYIKARFWPGETIWAKVVAINGSAIDATLVNHPAPAGARPPEFAHYTSKLEYGDPVSCSIDEVIDVIVSGPSNPGYL